MRWLAIAAATVASLLGLAAAIVYLQTEDGFRRVLVAAVTRAVDGELTVRRGRLRLDGSVEIDGLEFADTAAAFSLSLGRVRASLEPASLWRGRPRVVDFEVGGGEIRIERKSAGERKGAGEADSQRDSGGVRLRLPLEIERASVRDVDIRIVQQSEPIAHIGPIELQVRDLVEGRTARLDVATRMEVAASAADAGYSGSGRLSAAVDHGAGALLRVWQLDGEIEGRSGSEAPQHIAWSSRGAVEGDALDAEMSLRGRRGDAALGHVEAKLAAQLRRDDGRTVPVATPTRLTVDVQQLSAPLLAPFVALLGDLRLYGGLIDGSVSIEPAADDGAWWLRADIDCRDLRVARRGAAAPAMDVRVDEEATWHTADRRLEMQRAHASISLDGTEVLAARLLDPVSISFAAARAVPAPGSPPAALRLRLNDLPVDTADLWLALVGLELPPPWEGGRFDGELDAAIDADGTQVAFDGKLSARNIALRADGERATLAGNVRGTVHPASGVDFEQLALRMVRTGDAIASGDARGRVGWAPPVLDLRFAIESPDLSAALQPGEKSAVRGGRLLARGALTRTEDQLSLRVDDLAIDDIVVRVEQSELQRAVRGSAALRLADDVVQIDALALHPLPRPPTADAGCTASGSVALSRAHPHELAVRCIGFELTPWLELAGVRGWAALGETPADLEVTLRSDAAGTFRIAGTQRIALRSTGAAPVAFDLQSEIVRVADATDISLRLRSDRNPPDRARFTGTLRAGERARLHIEADVEQLDLEPLVAGRAQRRRAAGGGGRAPTGGKRELRAADLPRLPLDVDADVSIGRLVYRGVRLESGAIRARLAADRWEIAVTPMELAGGRVSGSMVRLLRRDGEAVTAELRANGVGMTQLTEAFSDGGKRGRVDGTLKLAAALRGECGLDEDLLDAVAGTIDAELRRGRVRGFNPMQFLGEKTGLRQLAYIPLERFDAAGSAEINRGVATLGDTKVTSVAANFDITGQIDLSGELDLAVRTRVGPEVARRLIGVGLLERMIGRVEGMVGLPMVIRIRGPIDDLKYRATAEVPDVVDGASGLLGDAVEGVGDIIDGVRGLFDRRRRR